MADDHTLIVETPRRGGGSGWIIALVLVVALVIGGVFVMQMSNSKVERDNAISNAANNVGQAARNVGDAAETAANNASNNK